MHQFYDKAECIFCRNDHWDADSCFCPKHGSKRGCKYLVVVSHIRFLITAHGSWTFGRAIIVGTDPFVSQSYLVPQDYTEMAKAYRPSHADLTYDLKYGVRSVQVPFSIYMQDV